MNHFRTSCHPNVIKAIDPKTSQSPSPDTAALRKQLAEKEKALTRMEDEAKNLKSVREREERMVLSAWYEMGMHVHKKGLEERFQPQVQSDPDLVTTDLVTTRFSDRINFPRYRKLMVLEIYPVTKQNPFPRGCH
eukprot:sb/3474739/